MEEYNRFKKYFYEMLLSHKIPYKRITHGINYSEYIFIPNKNIIIYKITQYC